MPFKQCRRLLQVGQHPGRLDCVLLRLALEGFGLRRLQSQAPVEVDAAEGRRFVEEGQPVAGERLRDRVRVLLLPGKIEAGHHAGVLVEAGALGQSAQSAFDLPDTGLKLLVGQSLFVQAR